MKKYICIWFMLLTVLCCSCAAPEQSPASADQPEIVKKGTGIEVSCMSFNVLSYDTHQVGYADASERAPLVVDFLLKQNCDIVGLQEVSEADGYNWVKTITQGVSDVYDIRYLTQEEDSAYTRMGIAAGLMILYRKDRFELLDSGCYEYYEDANRYYQWVKLKDQKSGEELYVTNTHFSIDPDWNLEYGDIMRTDEARELADFWESTVGEAPLLATGDYNSYEFDLPHTEELQTSTYQPSSLIAEDIRSASGVDFVYVNTAAFRCKVHDMMDNNHAFEGESPFAMSDHSPVIAVVEYLSK